MAHFAMRIGMTPQQITCAKRCRATRYSFLDGFHFARRIFASFVANL
jgi:hypothetical protein